ncbi:MAG: type II toxin-antitoxin system VapC family toxin [Xenococcaceae cyanobacterium MO_167.B27]|nr:type II toxin-antitoxin system VapC family toxin [Xenococcaceae cyanobacterium MO_167.B27]
MPEIICVDANFIVRLLSAPPNAISYNNLWRQWKTVGNQIIAPTIYCYEVTNVFHRMSLAGQILPEEAEQLLESALNLGITLYGDKALHQRALILARSLNLSAAYDAHYLALSERFNAEFYTSDRRLFNTVKDTFSWINLVT